MFSSTAIVHTDLLIHADVSFLLPHTEKADSPTRTFSFHWHSPHRLTRPRWRFLVSYEVHTGQLAHTDVFFFCLSLHRLTRLYKRYLFIDISHAGLFVQIDHLLLFAAVDERFICLFKIDLFKQKKVAYHFPPLFYYGCVQEHKVELYSSYLILSQGVITGISFHS